MISSILVLQGGATLREHCVLIIATSHLFSLPACVVLWLADDARTAQRLSLGCSSYVLAHGTVLAECGVQYVWCARTLNWVNDLRVGISSAAI